MEETKDKTYVHINTYKTYVLICTYVLSLCIPCSERLPKGYNHPHLRGRFLYTYSGSKVAIMGEQIEIYKLIYKRQEVPSWYYEICVSPQKLKVATDLEYLTLSKHYCCMEQKHKQPQLLINYRHLLTGACMG